MRIFNRFFITAVAALLLAGTLAAQSGGGEKPDSEKMFDELAQKDKELFDSVFVTCDLARLESLVTEDFEFYHDRAGQHADSGRQFVKAVGESCERRKTGADLRVKRELVEGSLKVFPLNKYGAIQTGSHRFYILSEGRENPAETALFIHLWKLEKGSWKLARVYSYDHKPVK